MSRFFDFIAEARRKILDWLRRRVDHHEAGNAVEGTSHENDVDETELELVPDTSWDNLGIESPNSVDPSVRLIVSLVEALDFEQFFRRTGIRIEPDGTLAQRMGPRGTLENQRLPLFVELGGHDRTGTLSGLTSIQAEGFVLHVPRAYVNELSVNPSLTWVTGQLELDEARLSRETAPDYASSLRSRVAAIIRKPGVNRVSVPSPLQPCLVDSLRDIDLPADRKVRYATVDGNGVIVGIIDDGCALAHRNFLVPGTAQSRIRYLWDQSRTDPAGGWATPLDTAGNQDFEGLELTNAAINAAINQPGFVHDGVIEEEKIYTHLNYEIGLASHGTHVMDIAAGNGASLMGTEGVAPAADIIFVQLPTDLIEQGGPVLEDRILDGVKYIFARAEALAIERGTAAPVPAVVNISYGGYSGPHDGSSPLASGIDTLLDTQTDRAVVISAGNGFEADAHARQGPVAVGGRAQSMRWILSPEDPTANLLEIWYEQNAKLRLSLTPPGATNPLKPHIDLGENQLIQRKSDNRIAGWINHVGTNTGANLNVIRILLRPTVGETGSKFVGSAVTQMSPPAPPQTAPAASGVWKIDLENIGTIPATFHAWIERDDLGRRGLGRRQQSRFDSADADPRYTLASLATGKHAICVGAYNTATDEVCRYSASGPTQDGRGKPEVCAPAEEDAAGRGILCASSRRAQPTRMNGTSASAPHVTGLVALTFQLNRDRGGAALTTDAIRAELAGGSATALGLPPPPLRVLRPNRHQAVDPNRPAGKKQSDDLPSVIGAGKINVQESLKLLP